MPIKTTRCRELKLTLDDAAQDGIAISCKAGIKVLDRHCIEGDSYGKSCGHYGEGTALSLGEMRERLGLDPRSGEPAQSTLLTRAKTFSNGISRAVRLSAAAPSRAGSGRARRSITLISSPAISWRLQPREEIGRR